MTVGVGLVFWLVLGALVLAGIAVLIDRINFPQKPFRPRRIHTMDHGSTRDRTGAHIVDETDLHNPTDATNPEQN